MFVCMSCPEHYQYAINTEATFQGCIFTAVLSCQCLSHMKNLIENRCVLCVSVSRWSVGDWQKCSASCGSQGLTKRTVSCIQTVSAEEQKALEPSYCAHIPKPESISSCSAHVPCPADWITGIWSKVSLIYLIMWHPIKENPTENVFFIRREVY